MQLDSPLTNKRVLDRDFATEWKKISQQVLAFCYHRVDLPSEAEEIFQQIAIRAWYGYASFNGDAAFLTWVMTIARREIARAMSHHHERSKTEASLEVVTEIAPDSLPSFPAPEMGSKDYSWLSVVTKIAASKGVLTQMESTSILTRLAHSEESWDAIGKMLGVSGTACATLHCRAIPKLRMFLFMYRPDLLGGIPAITEAFTRALADKSNRLNVQEIEVFQRIILDGQVNYRKAGWRLALRSACSKVIKWLSLP